MERKGFAMTVQQYLLHLWYLMFWPLLDPPESLREWPEEPPDEQKH